MGLTVKNLSQTFGTFNIDISLEAKSGELVTLLGPSGCGKTTSLQLIAGILNPEKGRIYLQNTDISECVPWKRDIGIVFQDYALFPHMNVAENIGYGLKYKRLAKRDINETVKKYLRLVHLSGYGTRMIDSLSGGEKQRVALARALAPSPRLLLLDEPLSALDVSLRIQLRREIRRIQQQLSITTIYVTHDQEEALTISDSIVIMNNGRVEQAGNPSSLFNYPKTKFTAEFLGPSNLIPGKIIEMIPSGGLIVAVTGMDRLFEVPFLIDFATGDDVWIFFRPGSTEIQTEKTHNRNILQGNIQHSEYYGIYTLFEIDVQGITIQAQQQGREDFGRYYRKNEKVYLTIMAEHCHLIKRDIISKSG